ncbi:hypothetical protein [Geodermatophilus sp. URMC 64]
MSQDAADPLAPTFLDTGSAQAPLLVLRADPVRGTVRLRGCLDRVGAELLTDRLLELRRLGHREVTVQLPSGSDRDAALLLAEVAGRVAADGLHLTVEEGTPPVP